MTPSITRATRPAFAMVGLLWRRLRRDRVNLAFTFLLPVAVAAVMVGIYGADYASVGLVVEGTDNAVGTDVYTRLDREGLVEIHRYEVRDDLERAVRRREVAAGLVVPQGAGQGTGSSEVELLGPPGIQAPSAVRAVVESAVAESAAALEVGRAADPDASPAQALRIGEAELAASPRPDSSGTTSEQRQQETVAWALVGALVLFVFVNTVGGAGSLAEMRELGVLERARTTQTSSGVLTVGYGLAMASYALVQAGLMLATGRLVFGVTWASWPALLAVVVVVSLGASAVAVVMSTFLPSPELGTTVAGPVAFAIGMLGGCLWPLDMVGPGLAVIGHLTPQAWAIDALRAVGIAGEGFAAVLPELGVLTTASLALLAIGGWRVHRIASHA